VQPLSFVVTKDAKVDEKNEKILSEKVRDEAIGTNKSKAIEKKTDDMIERRKEAVMIDEKVKMKRTSDQDD